MNTQILEQLKETSKKNEKTVQLLKEIKEYKKIIENQKKIIENQNNIIKNLIKENDENVNDINYLLNKYYDSDE